MKPRFTLSFTGAIILLCVSSYASITEFSAAMTGRSYEITLQWRIDQSDSGSVFEIFNSLNGQTWRTVDTVLGTETQNGTTFTYVHSSPYPGLNVYHVLQVNSSGDSSLSELQSVDFTRGAQCALYVYPNPVNNYLVINWESCDVVNWDVVIRSSIGKVVYYNTFVGSPHQFIYRLDYLLPGNYTVTTEAKGSKTQQLQFVKQ